jgi:hypothetical protein
MPAFPVSIMQLDKQWLEEALNCNISSFQIEPLGEGIGIIGLVTRITLVGKNCPKSLIAKFQSPSPENRAIAHLFKMYEREVQFYTQVLEEVPIRAPKCFHASFDPDSKAFILLLEDLQGYRSGDQVVGCTIDECQQVIDTMAALHRSTWQPDHLTDIIHHNTDFQIQGMIEGFTAGWPLVTEKFSHLIDSQTALKANNLPDHIERLLDQIMAGPLCIAHGDMRLDNFMFGSDHVALVDFQALCKSAPEHDLAYFLSQSPSQFVLDDRDWVAYYHQQLTSQGNPYPLQLCRERYRYCTLYFLCYAVIICSALDTGNERGKKLGETLLGNALISIENLDGFSLLT